MKTVKAKQAYCGGIFDGEGTVAYYTDENGVLENVRLAVTMYDKAPLIILKDTLGGIISEHFRLRKEDGLFYYTWVIHGKAAIPAAKILKKNTTVKTKQLEIFIKALTKAKDYSGLGEKLPWYERKRRLEWAAAIKAEKRNWETLSKLRVSLDVEGLT